MFWRGRARLAELQQLATRFLGGDAAQRLFADYARRAGVAQIEQIEPDARLVQHVETQLAGAIGSASARAVMASVVQEEPLAAEDILRMLDEASQVRALNRQLESLDRLKDDFMSSVTHELRTPLTSIRAFAELMRDDPAMDAPQRQQFLGLVVAEAERLSRLVNQVLDMAKIESGHAEWRSDAIDLRELIAHAVQTTAGAFRERGAQLQVEQPDQVPVLHADRDRLLQVLLNLLSNAVKFVPQGSGQVIVRLRSDDRGAAVEVCDNGPGVPAEQQQLVFEKFRQGGACQPPAAGHGAGPADQPPDRRTFRRPHVVEVGARAGRLFRVRAAMAARGDDTMTHKILIADDEPNIVISLEFLMKREGYAVSVARDGAAALEAIRRERPALVLLDVMMPGMSGFEVCQAVRADESLAGVKIVMLTAKGRDTDLAKGTALGADAYVTKPFSTRELAERVRELLAAA